jgi:succinate dehydrogenase/fumarate reductase flavoprotein subunit
MAKEDKSGLPGQDKGGTVSRRGFLRKSRTAGTRYNSFVDSGVDADFGKPSPVHKIETPPFYAAWATPPLHDVRSGLRINGNGQVMDKQGQIIPGLYAAGESASGISIHGLAKSIIFGRLGGMHAARQAAT